jgi:hypothetical protein
MPRNLLETRARPLGRRFFGITLPFAVDSKGHRFWLVVLCLVAALPGTAQQAATSSRAIVRLSNPVRNAHPSASKPNAISGPVIITVAGCCENTGAPGAQGYAGDGGQATGAEMYYPSGIAFDPAGDFYIGDSLNNVIRKVTAATGVITTVAGCCENSGNPGTGGYSGDGGPATGAELNGPYLVAFDAAGNLYIGDLYNNVIRKVTAATGVITTVAGNGTHGYSGDGGPATSAELFYPSGVAFDAAGNFYIGDTFNMVVRKVTVSTGIITTVAGCCENSGNSGTGGYSGDGGPATSAELYYPSGVATDAAGDLYIADMWNCVIREVTAATGIITTVAGIPKVCNYSGDGGPATGAALDGPIDVALDTAGNLYIADDDNNVIREVAAATGVITTVAGNGYDAGTYDGGYSGDGGPATSAELFSPDAVSVDAAGNFYIGDTYNNVVRKVDVVTTTLASSVNPSSYGQAVTLTATVSGGSSPTGTVGFTANSAAISGCSAVTLDSGQAQCTTSTLPLGAESIIAAYSGDSKNPGTSSMPVSQGVDPANLIVTAKSESMALGGVVPALSYTMTGFVLGDTQGTATTGQPIRTTTATSDSPAGAYPITITAGTLVLTKSYYVLSLVNGTLTINGAATAVGLFPGTLAFPLQGLGTTSTAQTITVTSLGTGALTISSIGVTGADTGDFGISNNCPISPSTLAANATCTISVKFTPTATGPRQAAVTIVSNAPTSPNAVFVSGAGTAVSLSPASLSFGGVAVGNSTTLPVTLTNLGSAMVHLWQLDMSGTNAGDFSQTNNCGASVAAQGSCTITVKFTPSASGTRTASLLLLDDGGGSPQAVGLSGSGSDVSGRPRRRMPPGDGPRRK